MRSWGAGAGLPGPVRGERAPVLCGLPSMNSTSMHVSVVLRVTVNLRANVPPASPPQPTWGHAQGFPRDPLNWSQLSTSRSPVRGVYTQRPGVLST
jgi:hypothetical protein